MIVLMVIVFCICFPAVWYDTKTVKTIGGLSRHPRVNILESSKANKAQKNFRVSSPFRHVVSRQKKKPDAAPIVSNHSEDVSVGKLHAFWQSHDQTCSPLEIIIDLHQKEHS